MFLKSFRMETTDLYILQLLQLILIICVGRYHVIEQVPPKFFRIDK